MRYLLDTSVLISFLRGRLSDERFTRPRGGRVLYASIISHGELARGAYRARSDADRELRLTQFTSLLLGKLDGVLPVTSQIADAYGQVAAGLDAIGQPLPVNDIWIAATALVHDLILVSEDRHFARVPGLKVENWAEGPQV